MRGSQAERGLNLCECCSLVSAIPSGSTHRKVTGYAARCDCEARCDSFSRHERKSYIYIHSSLCRTRAPGTDLPLCYAVCLSCRKATMHSLSRLDMLCCTKRSRCRKDTVLLFPDLSCRKNT